jgi:hypothetical protein
MAVRYTDARNLANTLADGAQYADLQGDDAEAVERLLDLLHLGRAMRQDPLLISQLVGIGIDALATDAAQQVAPTLALGPAGPHDDRDERPDNPCVAAGVARAGAEAHRGCCSTAGTTTLTSAGRSQRNARLSSTCSTNGRPGRGRSGRSRSRRCCAGWPGSRSSWKRPGSPPSAAARRVLARLPKEAEEDDGAPPIALFGRPPDAGTIPRYSRWFDEDLSGPAGLARAMEQHFRVEAERRATAVSFAARLYRHDAGRWPASLAELVPEYLPAVPIDPFHDGDQPLGYVVQRGALPGGGDRPLVYYDPGPASRRGGRRRAHDRLADGPPRGPAADDETGSTAT